MATQEGVDAHAAPAAPLTPWREESACHRALDGDLDRKALMKQSPRVLKQLAKNAGLSLVGIDDKDNLVNAVLQGRIAVPMAKVLAAQQQVIGATTSPSPCAAAKAPSTAGPRPATAAHPAETASKEVSERLVLLMSESKMLDMELVEAERQYAVYANKYNKEFMQGMYAHPSEIDGVEITDGDDRCTSSSSASTKELMKFVRKLMHSLALKVHPDKNPGRDGSDFQLLTKAEKELDLPAMLAMADKERIPVPEVPPAAIQECERRIAEKRSQLTEIKTRNAWSWGSAGDAPPAELRERIVGSMGLKYVGQLKNGKLHGYGNAEWPNGSWYKGQWRNNVFHGMGQHFMPGNEGYLYLGDLMNRMCDGLGMLKYNSGGSFVGEFAQGCQKEGIHTLENGDMLEGTFVDGLLTGLGKQIPSSNERTSCSGDFVGGRLHGHGTWELKGTTYTGDFREGHFHGFGVMRWPYKDAHGKTTSYKEYRGHYKDGRRHGVGQYECWDGKVTTKDATSS